MYSTGNPIPSAALEDMADNAQVFDGLVTKTSGTVTDRLGNVRRSFQQIIMDMGFQPLTGSFQAGSTVTEYNQCLVDASTGTFYSWNGALPKVVPAGSTPATAGGIGAGAWVDRTDVTLRSDLASESGSGLVGYQPAGTGAVEATVQSKLRETVSVFDFMNAEQIAAVRAGTSTNDTAAIQAAINHGLTTGKDVSFPAGRYVVTGTITADLRVSGNAAQRKYISLVGAGSHLCSIVNNLSSLTDVTINVLGAASAGVNNGDHRFVLSGIKLERLNTDYQGVGLGVFAMTGPLFSDVVISGFNKGAIFTDVLFAAFERVKVASCNEGLLIQTDAYSRANLTTLRNCAFLDATIFGVKVYGCNVEFDTCGFEGNGIRNAGYTCHSLWYQDSPDGYAGLTVKNSYFENNKGAADVYINAAWTGTHAVESNSFNRISSTNYVTSNILLTNIDGLGSAEQHLSLSNNGFLAVGTYVPDASRPKLSIQNVSGYRGWQMHDVGGNPGLYFGVDGFDPSTSSLKIYDKLPRYRKGTYTPVAEGNTSTPGVGAYAGQKGYYERIGDTVFFAATVSYSAHTGVGTLKVSLPPIAPDTSLEQSTRITAFWTGRTVTSGTVLSGAVYPALNTTVGAGCVRLSVMTPAGTEDSITMANVATTIQIAGFYRAAT